MKNLYSFGLFLCLSILLLIKGTSLSAQISGTKNIPTDYATLASAISALNASGVGTGGVIINVPAGWTETAPAGGYQLGSSTLNASTSSTKTITIQKSGSGANPLITANTGSSLSTDGIFIIQGTDYATISSLDLRENPANATSTTRMEWGYALVKLNSSAPFDGCNNVTIQNCTITLNQANTASVGIYAGCHTATNTTLLNITSTSDAMSNCTFKGNTVTNDNTGISLNGFTSDVYPFSLYDQNNTIGGTSSGLGNSITNFGGTSSSSYGVFLKGQNNALVKYNTITSALTPGTGNVYAMYLGRNINSAFTAANNTIQMTASTGQIFGITNGTGGTDSSGVYGLTASLTITGNVFQNYAFTAANSQSYNYLCVYNYAGTLSNWDLGLINISNNIAQNMNLNTTGTYIYFYYTYYCNANDRRFNNNKTSNVRSLGTGVYLYNFYNYGGVPTGPATDSVVGNKVSNCSAPRFFYGFYDYVPSYIHDKVIMYDTLTNDSSGLSNSGNFYSLMSIYGNNVTLKNNYINGIYTSPTYNSSVYLGYVYNGATLNSCNNNFSNVNAYGCYPYYHTNFTNYASVHDNVVNNLTLRLGTTYGVIVSNVAGYGNDSIYNNTIQNFSFTGGTFYGIYGNATSGQAVNIFNNKITGITSTGSSTYYLHYLPGTATTVNVSNDSVYNITSAGGTIYGFYNTNGTVVNAYDNYLAKITNTGPIYGMAAMGGSTVNFYRNTIDSFSSNVAGINVGIFESGPSIFNCYRNKISGLIGTNALNAVYGIYLGNGITNVYNNVISDLQSTNLNSTGLNFCGIYCGGGLGHTISFNSVYLNASSTGTDFGSSALYSFTSTPITLRNNILINKSTPSGAGITYAYRRNNATTSTYSTSSDHNLFYAGTPGAANLIYGDGTNALQTLASYKAFIGPADGNSITENTTFLATTGIGSNLLSPNTSIPTGIESSCPNISGITDDKYGTIRAGNTGYSGTGIAPDCGAIEGNFTPNSTTPPGISFTPFSFTCSTGDRSFTATITDIVGVPVSGTLMPRVYFRKNSGSWYSNAGSLVSGNSRSGSWNFTITASAMGGLINGDSVYYFVIAQDSATTPNIGSSPGGVTATDVNTITGFPSTPFNYRVSVMSGNYNIGTSGAFTTITAAVNTYNNSCLTGPVTFTLTDATYPSESFPITINGNSYASATNSLTITPASGTAVSITDGSSDYSVFKLKDASYVTIDGVNSGGASLTLNNSNTGNSSTIWLTSNFPINTGCSHISLKNMNLNGGTNTYTLSTAILVSKENSIPSTNAGYNNNYITIQGNTMLQCGIAIVANPNTIDTTQGWNSNWVIINNTIGPAAYNATTSPLMGMYLGDTRNALISNNIIRNIGSTTYSGQCMGIYLYQYNKYANVAHNTITKIAAVVGNSNATAPSGISLGAYTLNSKINANVISDISNWYNSGGSGYGATGIELNTNTPNSYDTIENNMISNIYSYAYAYSYLDYSPVGIGIDGSTGNVSICYNTVNMNSSFAGSPGATYTACIYHNSSGHNFNVKNNILVNTYDNTASSTDVGYLISTDWDTTYFSGIDYNDYYVGGPGRFGYNGFTDLMTFATMQSGFGSSHCKNVNPAFISGTDLHLQISAYNTALDSGIAISGITKDIDDSNRYTPPYMGADDIGTVYMSGTYTVGTGGDFHSLTGANGLFYNINTRGLSGNVTAKILSDLAEDGANSLNQWSETGTGNYHLSIVPDTNTLRTVSGNVLSGMIRLSGADRVTIDGRNSGSGQYLLFRNTNTAGSTGTAFTFINGAANNSIKYCGIEGYANATNGVVLFSTSAVAGGNSNDTIDHCNINGTVAGNNANVDIYSAGTVGNENTGIVISNNNIYNHRDRGIDVTATGSTNWIVSGNNIYNGSISGGISYSSGSLQYGIRILGGTGYTVMNNNIGGSAPNCGGSAASYVSAAGIITYEGIMVTTTSGNDISNIKGNTVTNISVSCVPTTANQNVCFGIDAQGYNVNIGGNSAGEGNTIGSNITNGSISVSTSTSSASNNTLFYGIYATDTGGVINGNFVGGIDINNVGSAPAGTSFRGINVNSTAGPSQVNNNIIGSTGAGAVPYSIRVLSGSLALSSFIHGIVMAGAVAGNLAINGNVVKNIGLLSVNTTSGAVTGINIAVSAYGSLSIQNDSICNIKTLATTGYFYAIYHNSNSAGSYIQNNTIFKDTTLNLTTGNSYYIYSVSSPISLTVRNNIIRDNATISASQTGAMVGIYNTGAPNNLRMNSNTILGISTTSPSAPYYAIDNGGAINGLITMDSNTVGNATSGAFNFYNASSAANTFFQSYNGTASASLSISYNNIQGINYSAASTGASTFILNSGGALTRTFVGNTFTNLNLNSTGNISFIIDATTLPSSGIRTVSNNSIVGSFTKSGSGGTVTLFSNNGTTSNSGSTINQIGNNFSNINLTGATTMAGWINTDAGVGATTTIENDTFTNWTCGSNGVTAMNINNTGTNNTHDNLIHKISGSNSITGIFTNAGSDNIYNNIIDSLTSTGAASVIGAYVNGGTTQSVYKNKIYDLTNTNAGGTVYGVTVASGTTVNVTNNLIGNLFTPSGSGADPIRGINITSGSAPSNINVYYNTIYLNAASTAATFGTTGIFHTANATATTGTLDMRNNSITNVSTQRGGGYTVAFRRSGTTLSNFAATSNNNMLYASNPVLVNRLIYYDGTNTAQSLYQYKTLVASRDAQAISEDLVSSTKFLSTTGGSSNFLHIDTTKPTQLESGGVAITGFGTDYDGDIRNSTPDIGADEFTGSVLTGLSGTYTVGTGGDYFSLTGSGGLFSDVNTRGLSGNTIVKVKSDLAEDGSNALLAWTETGVGNYSLTIVPDTNTVRVISGNVINGLIKVGGANRFRIDGRNGGSGQYLTFRNTNTNPFATNTVFTYALGASNNSVRYCNIEAYSGTSDIYFSTSTVAGGNSNDTIDHCNITASLSGLNSSVAISATGTVGNENSNIVISNNNISNYVDRGISIPSTGNTGWTIIGNSFYNGGISGGLTYPAGSQQYGIQILGGSGYNILNNYIGGSSPNAGGSAASYSSPGILSYEGIVLTTTSGIQVSNIKGNTINNIALSSTHTAANTLAFTGIDAGGYNINIGGSSSGDGNRIGSNSVNGAISVTTSTTININTNLVKGINVTDTGGVVTGNRIGGIDINNLGSAPAPSIIYGIYINSVGGPSMVDSNVIGSTGAGAATNSIRVVSGSTAVNTSFTGIQQSGTVVNNLQWAGDIVKNVSMISTSNTSGAFIGLYPNVAAYNGVYLFNDSVSNNTFNATTGSFYGINPNSNGVYTSLQNNVISGNSATNLTGGSVYYIYGQNTPVNMIMNNNAIVGNSCSCNSMTGSIVGVYNYSNTSVLKMNNNTVQGNSTSTASGLYYALINSGAINSSINIDSNIVGSTGVGAVSFTSPNSGSHNLIYNSNGYSTTSESISYNVIQGISFASGSTASINLINNYVGILSRVINNNVFNSLNLNTSGNVTFIYDYSTLGTSGVRTVNNNSIVGGFTKPASGGTVTLFTTAGTASGFGSVVNENGNNFSNITLTGATTMAGWVNVDAGVGVTTIIQNDTFANWTCGSNGVNVLVTNNTGTNSVNNNILKSITGSGAITGIYTSAGNTNIYNNTIDTFVSTGAVNISGIWINGGNSLSVYKNKIYDLTINNSGGSVYGINITSGTTSNVSNNLIGNLWAPIANAALPVIGINANSSLASSNINIYFNTIYLSATSLGATFGSAGIYHAASATGTTANLDMRDNIITNTSSPNGGGYSAAFRRSGAALANYATTSNNNLFYAGTPSANRLIYYNGTSSYQTLASFKTLVSAADAQSVTEDLVSTSKFLSTVGSSVNFLHIDSTRATYVEGGGVTVGGYTTDFDGNVRNSSPDIGADEYNGFAQILGYAGLCLGSTTTLSHVTPGGVWSSNNTGIAIVDTATGVVSGMSNGNAVITYAVGSSYAVVTVTVGLTAPAVISGPNLVCVSSNIVLTDATAGGTYSVNNSNCSIVQFGTSCLVSGVSAGVSIVSYTVGGCSSTQSVTINPLPGAIIGYSSVIQTDSITLSDTTAGGTWSLSNAYAAFGSSTGVLIGVTLGTTVASYTSVLGCTVTKSIAITTAATAPLTGLHTVGTGGDFTTLTGAGGLFSYVNSYGLRGDVSIKVISDLTEPGTFALNQWVESGIGNYMLSISPDTSILRTISGNVLAGMIRYNGADRMKIDGRFSGSGQYLTFRNTNITGTTGTAFTFQQASTNNVIRYCNLEAFANATNGVVLFSTSGIAGGNSYDTIDHCNINCTVAGNTSLVGVYSAGTTGIENTNNVISNNSIYNFRDRGVDITSTGSSAWIINGNSIYNGAISGTISYGAGSLQNGIRILGGTGYSILNNYIGGSASNAVGSSANYSSAGVLTYEGIILTTTGGSLVSNIKGNTITNIALSIVPTAAGAVAFNGINVAGYNVNIGGSTAGEGNIIGSNSMNGAITITTSTNNTTNTSAIRGIYCTDTGGVITGNLIGGIDIANVGISPAASTICGIYTNPTSSGPSQIDSNIIGSSGTGAVANSLRVLSTSTATSTSINGLLLNGYYANSLQVAGNVVKNVSLLTNSNTTGSLVGISVGVGAYNVVRIINDTVSDNTLSSTTGSFYGIYHYSSGTTSLVQNCLVSGNTSTRMTSGSFYSIYNTSSPTSMIVRANTVLSNTLSSTMSGAFVGVYSNASPTILKINSNIIAGTNTNSPSAAIDGIYTAGYVTASINIDSNSIGTNTTGFCTFGTANSISQQFISNNTGLATAALSICNNDFRGVTYTAASAPTNIYFIINNNNVISRVINNNTFNGINLNTAGNVSFISETSLPASGIRTINNNKIIGGFTKTGSGGTVTMFTNNGYTSGSGSVISENGNNFSNVTVSGTTAIGGWVNTDAGVSANTTIQNDTFTNWSAGTGSITVLTSNHTGSNSVTGNVINNISSGGAVTGIYTWQGNTNVSGNYINSLSASGGVSVMGIHINGGTVQTIEKNKIYDLSNSNAGGTVYGITVLNGASVNLSNNYIGDLRAPVATSTDAIRGISITNTTALTAVNVYFNTVYLNSTSSGTNFGTSGIFHTASATATTSTLNMRNNIITNYSTANGTGLAVAFRRSGTVLSNFALSSNNNLFYAGTPGPSKLIYYDGTNNIQSLTSYKALVTTRDMQSVTENLLGGSKFLSTSGLSSSFLHMDPTKPTQVESGGIAISGLSSDFEGDSRNTPPDIGADEFAGTILGGLNGRYTVGASGDYPSLTCAGGLFEDVNARGLSGNVIVKVISDLSEDGSNNLSQWAETGIGNYTLSLVPDTNTLRTISGNVLAGMIRLNGAKRFKIDGRNSGSGQYLTFRNTNTAGTTGTAFTFIQGATNNAIRYCTLEGFANATNGVVLFASSTVLGGNSNDTIDHCNINGTVGGNTANVCIYSTGTVGNENTGIVITNNSIFDYRDRGLDITASGSTAWILDGNSIYNGGISGGIGYIGGSLQHGIRILGGSGYSILNNYIGGSASNAGGTAAGYTSSGILTYEGIVLNTSGGTVSSNVKGNTITNLSLTSAPTSANTLTFAGIDVAGYNVNIGGSTPGHGNLIGSNTANGAISISTSTTINTNNNLVKGINVTDTGGVVTGNQIGGIDISNVGTSPAPTNFYGIFVNSAGGPSMVDSNVVGSTGAGAAYNSIRILATSSALNSSITGIQINGAVANNLQVAGNVVKNTGLLSSVNTSGSLIGLNINLAVYNVLSIVNDSVSSNTLNCTTGGFNGILHNSTAALALIDNNTVSGNSVTNITNGQDFYINNTSSSTDVKIRRNTVVGNSVVSSGMTSSIVGIYNTGAPATLTVNENLIAGNSTNSATGLYYAILNSGGVLASINIDSNSIGNGTLGAITFNAANSGAQQFINNNSGQPGASLSISYNNIQGVNYLIPSSGSNTFIFNGYSLLSRAINSNTFNGLSINTTGGVTFIQDNGTLLASGIRNVNNNTIVGSFTKSASGGTITLFTNNSTNSGSGSTINENGNNFSNINVTGVTNIAGWVNTDAGVLASSAIQNNTFGNWTFGSGSVTGMNINVTGSNTVSSNVINNFTGSGSITGFSSGSGNVNLFGNIINTLSSTGAVSVTGISVTGGTMQTVHKNKIYDLSNGNASGTISGVTISGGTSVNLNNNLIGDLRATSANGADPIRGINLISSAVSSSIGIYFNTIYLDAVSSGTNFGSTGIYHTASAISTTAALDMRNNIVTNTSSPSGTGLTVAFRRSGSPTSNYAATSNNNLFYAGTPGVGRLLHYDGTNSHQSIATYLTLMSTKDNHSVTQDLISTACFKSIVGSSADFLHIDTTRTTLAESGGIPVSGLSVDFEGDIRNNPPDIGADEFGGVNMQIFGGNAICVDDSIRLFDLALGGIWTSSNPAIASITPDSGLVTGVASGSVIITYYLSGVLATRGFTVNPLPTVSAGSSVAICSGQSASINALGGVSYSWYPATGLSATTGSSVISSPSTTTSYTVVGTSSFGCLNTAFKTVSVNSLPMITSISNNGPLCASDTLTLGCAVSGSFISYNYSWSGPSSFSSAFSNPLIPAATSAASGVYSLTVTDSNGCVATGPNTTVVTIYSIPSIISITSGGAVCAGTTLSLSSSATGGSGTLNYSWVGPSAFTSSLTSPYIDSAGTAATGIYTLTVTDANGCLASGINTTAATVNPVPAVGPILGSPGLCVGGTTALSDTTAGGVWSIVSSVATIGSATGIVSGVAISGGLVSYTVTNAFGCTGTATKDIYVAGALGNIHTFSGTGVNSTTGDGAAAYLATMQGPRDLITDNAGNVYFADINAHMIRKISTEGLITKVAGTGAAGNTGDGGQATAATLNAPNGMFVDNTGNLFIANTNSHTIRKVSAATGIITTIAGTSGTAGGTGDGGPATAAKLSSPLGLTGDGAGNLYICDQGNYKIRKINTTTGIITTVAGTGSNSYWGDGGQGTAARLSTPRGVSMDKSGNLYIADALNYVVRKLNTNTGIITTVAGNGSAGSGGDGGQATAAQMSAPSRLAYDGGSVLYITDMTNNKVRQVNIKTGIISTAAGTGTLGFSGDGGAATAAKLSSPCGVACDKLGNMYTTDASNRRIRVVATKGSISINIAGSTTVSPGTTVNFTAYASTTVGVTYQWQKNGGNVGTGLTSYNDSTPADGDVYRCILAVTPSCGSAYNDTSNSITIMVSSSRHSDTTVAAVSAPTGKTTNLYPNPVHISFTIIATGLEDGKADINVYDQLGKMVASQKSEVTNGRLQEIVDGQQLPPGIYVVSVADSSGNVVRMKCVKE